MPHRSYRWLLFSLAVLVFAADQGSKYGMFNWLHSHGERAAASTGEEAFERDVIAGWFKFHARYVTDGPACDCPLVRANGPVPPAVNHGALWSLGGEFKTDANKFFAVVSFLAALGISVWTIVKKPTDRWLVVSLGLILGGTLGNFFDRVVFGGVRDFLCFYWFRFPVFNLADSCLVTGAIMLLLQAFFVKPKEDAPAPAAEPTPPPAAN
jgi:lipoprotein signal peptidase